MSSKTALLNPPRGMRDFYPEDMRLRSSVFCAWRKASELFGFSEYDSCVVESLDLLKRKSGEEIVEQIYAFQDKSGRDLALRPEITPTLARMVAVRQSALSFPIKWYTIGQCFRYERMTKGRKREHYQWNMDIIGEASVAAEAEVIAAAITAMVTLGVSADAFRVFYSNRALLSEILSNLGIAPSIHSAAFLALDKRGKQSDEQVEEELENAGIHSDNAKRILDLRSIKTLEDARSACGKATNAMAETLEFESILNSYGLAKCVEFDLSVIRGLAYYTGIVFEAFDIKKAFRAIFGGGRYANLLKEVGGRPMPGVGLGFGDVVISEILSQEGTFSGSDAREGSVAVGFMKTEQRDYAIQIACRFRQSGRDVDLSTREEKAKSFFSRVGKGGFEEAVYLGPDDVESGSFRVKNLESRSEREEPFPSIQA